MTLLTEPTRIVLAKGYALPDDADAVAYIAAVEAADGQALESATRMAINSFVKGCKADGIWPAIKASCILAGARTLTGALIPLAGTAPTNVGPFVSGDYNRKTGLVGNGSTKYLNSNRNNNTDPQNSRHAAAFATTRNTEDITRAYIRAVFATEGGLQVFSGAVASKLSTRCSDATTATSTANLHVANGFFGVSRSISTQYQARGSATNETITQSSVAPGNANYFVFAGNNTVAPSIDLYSNARLAFYSIGESLNLELLDTRVTRLLAEIAFTVNTGLSGSSYNLDTLNYINGGYAAGGSLA